MTSVIMIAPLNATNFESGNAPDTQALFADGEGGTEWREPADTPQVFDATGVAWAALSSFVLTTAGRNARLGDIAVGSNEDEGPFIAIYRNGDWAISNATLV